MGALTKARQFAQRISAPRASTVTAVDVSELDATTKGPNFPPLATIFSALRDSDERKLSDPYKGHAWVYACIDAITRSLTDLPIRFYRGEPEEPEVSNDPVLRKLFESPSPQVNSQTEFFQLLGIRLLTKGKAFIAKMGRDGLPVKSPVEEPAELLIIKPQNMQPIRKKGWLVGWQYRSNQIEQKFLDYQVVFFKRPDPENPWGGLSPLQAAENGVQDDYLATKYNRAFFKNAGIVSGVLSFAGAANDDTIRRAKAQIQAEHGGARNAFKIIALEQGTKFEDFKLSQKDMEFLDQRRWSREEILAVFGCNKHSVGLTDDYNKANSVTAEKAFHTRAVRPLGGLIAAALWGQWLRFRRQQTWLWFDDSNLECFQDDRGDQALILGRLQQAGVSLRECNRVLDLGLDLEGNKYADTIWVRRGLMPAEMAFMETGTGGSAGGDGEKAAIKAAVAEVLDEKLSKLPLSPPAAKDDAARMPRKLLDEKAAYDAMRKYLTPVFDDAVEASAEELAEELSLAGGLGWDPDESESLAKFFDGKWDRVKTIPKRFHKRMKKKIRKAIAEGDTVQDIAKMLDEHFSISKKGYSATIARTEVGDVLDNTRFIAMQENGVPKHGWLTAGDDAVRDSHALVDGEVVKVGKPFSNGLHYPHDPEHGGAGEKINCRCTSYPVMDDEDEAGKIATAGLWAKAQRRVSRPLERRVYDKTLGWYDSLLKEIKENLRKANR